MALLKFLRRSDSPEAAGAEPFGDRTATRPAPVPDAVARARQQARRRLIGAVVLLGIGIIGFPILFQTQPRPVPVDLPIDIPRKDKVPPLEVPEAKPASAPPAPQAAAAPEPSAPPAALPDSAPPPPATPTQAASTPAAPKPVASTPAAPTPAASTSASDDKARFIVQVGAFAETEKVRELRSQLERMGLKTYTQEVGSDGEKRLRVRLGPFKSRQEAAEVLARIKAAGLPGAILSL